MAPEASLFYVFGICFSRESPKLPEGITMISCKEISAIVKIVPASEFGSEVINNNIKDTTWVTHQVTYHHYVLTSLCDQATVLPFKFGAIYKSASNIATMLDSRNKEFLSLLQKVEGMAEWTLKVYIDKQALTENLSDKNSDLRNLDEQIQMATKGKQFILRKKKEKLAKELTTNKINSLINNLHETVNTRAVKYEQRALAANETTGDGWDLCLNINYLVNKKEHLTNVDLYTTIGGDYKTFLKLDLLGPFPVTNFI